MQVFRIKALGVIVILLGCTLLGEAKNVTGEIWTRVASEKNEVSVSFPKGYLVDAHKLADGQSLRIISYQNGVLMELKVVKALDSENRLDRIFPVTGEEGNSFKIGGIKGRQMTSIQGGGFSERIYLAAGDRFYTVSAKSPIKDREEIRRFNYSILVGGQPLYERKTLVSLPEETVMAASLTSNHSVEDAYVRKTNDQQIAVQYQPEAKFAIPVASGTIVRPVIVLEKPNPDHRLFMQPGTRPPANMSARLVIKFLASGQIAEIAVYSDSSKSFAKACVEAAKKIKFLPARDVNSEIDSVVVEDYRIMTASTT